MRLLLIAYATSTVAQLETRRERKRKMIDVTGSTISLAFSATQFVV